METGTIDALFLELSQISRATTGKELALMKAGRDAVGVLQQASALMVKHHEPMLGTALLDAASKLQAAIDGTKKAE